MTRALLALLAAVAAPRIADACTCPGRLDTRVRIVSPPPGVLAPTNTRIRLQMDAAVRLEAVTLRSAAGTTRGSLVEHAFSTVRVVELIPVKPLLPSTRHEVVVRRKGRKDEVVGVLITGTGEDATAPVGGQRIKASVHDLAGCNSCCARGPWGVVVVEDAEDPGMPVEALVWHVWRPAPGAKPGGQPDAVLFGGRSLQIGLHPMSCGPAALPAPKQPIQQRIIARPVDLAGHLGPPIEATLDFAHPVPPP